MLPRVRRLVAEPMKHSNQVCQSIGFAVVLGAAVFGQQQLKAEDCSKPSTAKQNEPAGETIDPRAIPFERISLFKVSLQCAAAPEIGCGSRAKPLLGDLENQPGLTGTWLNGTGTWLAVAGNEGTSGDTRSAAVRSASEKRKVTANELTGSEREKALKDFHAGSGWRGGARMDELGKKEAEIIAVRLVRRISAKSELTEEKANTLRAAFARVFSQRFGKGETQEPREELLRIASGQLDANATAAFQEAVAAGYRPLAGEK